MVGVLGPWGFGKTSFVNLARLELEKAGVPILDFNPWMFSGAEQLVDHFFIELSAQLRIKPGFEDVARDLEEYGEMFSGLGWIPVVGTWIERGRALAAMVRKALQRRKEGVKGRKEKLRSALRLVTKPIVVVLDDIDRLSTAEIRDVFKLVRLTASFPQIIYVVAFDRLRVEQALGEQGVPGRDYLEKILQLAIDLPAIPAEVLHRQVFEALNQALAGIDDQGPFDEGAWPDIFMEVVRPLIRNMRDIRRYAAAVGGAVRDMGGQIALADVMALEAVRVFLPDVFKRLPTVVDALTSTRGLSMGDRSDDAKLKDDIQELLKAAGDHQTVVRNMIARLFPAGVRHIGGTNYMPDWERRWLRDRRVAHEDILRLYLERVAGRGLEAFNRAEKAWSRFADRQALDEYLRSLPRDTLQDVIAALEGYEDQFAPEQVVPATTVLLNLLPELPERDAGMFDFGTKFVVTRVTYRLMKSLKDPAAIEAAARQILPNVTTLSAKLELVSQIGHQENKGHKLVSEAAAADLEKSLRDEVRAASVEDLLDEKDLLMILWETKHSSKPPEPDLVVDHSPRVTLALLQHARYDMRSQTMGNRAVRRSPRLHWDILVDLFGGEDLLKERIAELKATAPEGIGELLALADRYAGGWKPNRRDEM